MSFIIDSPLTFKEVFLENVRRQEKIFSYRREVSFKCQIRLYEERLATDFVNMSHVESWKSLDGKPL